MKGDNCHGGKHPKDLLTILPCASMDDIEKMLSLVIGKSMKPRCFKGVKILPTPYHANKKVWMTGDISLNGYENMNENSTIRVVKLP